MDVSALLRRLAFCTALLLVAKIATFGHATIVPLGLTISKPGVQPGYVIFGAPDGHAYAIDVKGNVAKKWSSPEPNSELEYARPLANGNLPACSSSILWTSRSHGNTRRKTAIGRFGPSSVTTSAEPSGSPTEILLSVKARTDVFSR